jgi:tetratricopeptide (TPR) repeat protein
MKTDHRHELKTNELAEWIANLPQWVRQNRTTIAGVAVVIAIIAGFYFWRFYSRNITFQQQLRLTSLISQLSLSKMRILQAKSQGRDLSFMLSTPAGNLQVFAENTSDNRMAALALIKQAEALRTELHYRSGTTGEQDYTAKINQAKTSYTKALQKASSSPTIEATAKLGLALCEEELGNFDQAAQIYQQIAASPTFAGTAAKSIAEHRVKTLNDYKAKVVFRPAPKPEPLAIPTLPTEIGPAETNLPADTNLPIDMNLTLEAPTAAPKTQETIAEPQGPNSAAEGTETIPLNK